MTFEERAALLYEAVFRDRHKTVGITSPGYPDPASQVAVAVEHIATLKVPTGVIIACDPTEAVFPEDCPPFVERFPQGDWPGLWPRPGPRPCASASSVMALGRLARRSLPGSSDQ
jgi:hypothetical protein